MRKWAILVSLMGAWAFTGCYIEVDEPGDEWAHWDDDVHQPSLQERAREACEPYCLKLIQCDAISDSSLAACLDLCVDRYKKDEYEVSAGCTCVDQRSCEDPQIANCEGDPIPGVWDDGMPDLDPGLGGASGDGDGDAGGTSGDGDGGTGATSGDGDGDAETCKTNHECALASDCIDGQCLARCAASCQCQEGEACVAGYCQLPDDPADKCDDDCDCTSGERCVSGSCR